jgi:hypothetical protein
VSCCVLVGVSGNVTCDEEADAPTSGVSVICSGVSNRTVVCSCRFVTARVVRRPPRTLLENETNGDELCGKMCESNRKQSREKAVRRPHARTYGRAVVSQFGALARFHIVQFLTLLNARRQGRARRQQFCTDTTTSIIERGLNPTASSINQANQANTQITCQITAGACALVSPTAHTRLTHNHYSPVTIPINAGKRARDDRLDNRLVRRRRNIAE